MGGKASKTSLDLFQAASTCGSVIAAKKTYPRFLFISLLFSFLYRLFPIKKNFHRLNLL
jgi:hypothetical protein